MTTRLDTSPDGEAPFDSTLLDRYWAGEASQEELAMLSAWREANPGQAAALEQIHEGLRAGDWSDLSSAQEDEQVSALMDAIQSPSVSEARRVRHSERLGAAPSSRRWAVWSGIATVATVIGVVLGVTINAQRTHAELASFSSTYTTGDGERAKILLPDGSAVTLNVGSRLEVPANYAIDARTIRLEGEAIFSVRHRNNQPFEVIAGQSVTRVLGTNFVVRHYATDEGVSVAVRDGKVAVGTTVVAASRRAEMDAHGNVTLHEIDPGQFSFEHSVLTLPRMSLSRAAAELNRWYNADIQFGDARVAHRMIRGQFAAGSLADLSEYLTLMYDLRVVRTGRDLTLYER